MNTAKQWLRSTFLAVRLAKNPHHYQLNDGINSARNSDRRLENICEREIDILTTHRLINNSNGSLCCTAYGKSMARYYIRFPTMCTLMKAGRGSKISELVSCPPNAGIWLSQDETDSNSSRLCLKRTSTKSSDSDRVRRDCIRSSTNLIAYVFLLRLTRVSPHTRFIF